MKFEGFLTHSENDWKVFGTGYLLSYPTLTPLPNNFYHSNSQERLIFLTNVSDFEELHDENS